MAFDPGTHNQLPTPIYRPRARQGPSNIATSPANSTMDPLSNSDVPWYGAASQESAIPIPMPPSPWVGYDPPTPLHPSSPEELALKYSQQQPQNNPSTRFPGPSGPFDPGPQIPNPPDKFGSTGTPDPPPPEYYDPYAVYRQSVTGAPQPQTLGQLAAQDTPKRGGYWNEFGEWIQ